MTADPTALFLHRVRTLVGPPPGPEVSDRELIHRFAGQRDEAAFEALVHRHGPMVLRVGRRVLTNDTDVEDVFQATFLVLARKASAVRWNDSIANWLYGVAHRLARKAKDAALRRSVHEARAPVRSVSDPLTEITGRELLGAFDEEMLRLPGKYREPLLLCYLEGLTRDEAARRLGCPLGTLKSRVERGRDLLGQALTRRGIGLGAALLSSLVAAGRGTGGVPPALLRAALRGARSGVAGVTPSVAALAEGALSRTFLMKAKGTVALTVALVLAAGVAVAVSQNAGIDPSQASAPPGSERDAARATDALGDPLPEGVILRLGSLRLRHRGTVRSIAFSPDGKLLVSAGWDPVLRFWDPKSGREVRQIDGPTDRVEAIAFAPGGKQLALATDKYVSLLDVASGKEVRRLEGHDGRVEAVAFAPDGKSLASADKETVRLWEADSGKMLRTLEARGGGLYAVAFEPAGRTVVAAGEDRTARVWDTKDGKLLYHLRGHERPITGVAFSPDGKALVTVGDDAVRSWDAATGKPRDHESVKVRHGKTAAFSPNGKVLALGTDDGSVRLWDWSAGKELDRVDAHPARVQVLAFAPDGKSLASASAEESIQLWDTATGRSLDPTPGHSQRVRTVAYSADGRVIATAAWDGTVLLWDAHKGQVLRKFEVGDGGERPAYLLNPRQLADLALAPDGKRVAVAGHDGVVRVWDAATGKETFRCEGRCVAFAPDGKLLAVGGRGIDGAEVHLGLVRLFDAATGKEVRSLRGHLTMVGHVAFSADGTTLVSTGVVLLGARDGSPGENETRYVRFWDVATGRERRGFPRAEQYQQGTLSPDGRTLAGTADRGKSIVLWETATGQRRRELTGHTSMLFALAFAPDGRTLASGGMDGTVRLWDLPSGKEVTRLEGHRGWVLSVAFAPDGTRLVSGGLDTTALVWDIRRHVRREQPAADLDATEIEAQWKALAGDASTAYAASARLVEAPGQAVELLRERLRPEAPPDERRLARLIADLDSDSFDRREEAAAALEALGERAGPALRRALKEAPPEARRRIEALLGKLDEGLPTADELRGLRCIEVLERLGGDEARRVLEGLAGGLPEARLTQAAKAARERLSRDRR
jgi:RNA polymerase sigma factor (sigma-70 family)